MASSKRIGKPSTISRILALVTLEIYLFSIAMPVFSLPNNADNPVNYNQPSALSAQIPVKSASYSQEVFPDQEAVLSFQGVKLEIPAGAVAEPVTISIEQLADVQALNPGMKNVTSGSAGYRFKPDGMVFEKDLRLTLPYQQRGDQLSEVYSFFYNTKTESWEMLQRVAVDKEKGVLTSLTNHFTDIINSTISLPQAPEIVNFNPTTIKDIKAATPAAGVRLIDPPAPSSQGSASLSYPLEIPPGRNGMAPRLMFNYNSDGSNGWTGLGWNISIPAISIDTRWGVPRYSSSQETESYLLNGQQLTPLAQRGELVPREAEKIFHSRVETGYQQIIRHGDSPVNYWWEITDKNGAKYFYGGTPEAGFDPSSVLASPQNGNIFHWGLRQTRDTYGNTVDYSYTTVADRGLGDGSGGEQGMQLYIRTIYYTGTINAYGKYSVEFLRDREISADYAAARRPDVSIDGRGGFKIVTADVLKRIDIKYQDSLIRRYSLEYESGPFFKTLLKRIKQQDKNGADFVQYEFEYFDEVSGGSGYNGFAGPEDWQVPAGDIEIPLLFDLFAQSSALGSSLSDSWGIHSYLGVGPGPSKTNSTGVKLGAGQSHTAIVIALADINGDGLSDKVYKSGSSYYYRPNISRDQGAGTKELFGSSVLLDVPFGVEFSRDKSQSFTAGGEAYAAGAYASAVYSQTRSETSAYFTDINGDGLLDIVDKGKVYYNRLIQGVPSFKPDVAGTPVAMDESGADLSGMVVISQEFYDTALKASPLYDAVRSWTAPFTGTVAILAPVALKEYTDAEYKTADGVKVAIQYNNSVLWQKVIGPGDFSLYTPSGLEALSVVKGERVYFRVNSRYDGAYDQVSWDPEIRYLGKDDGYTDVNGLKPYVYKASKDFSLLGGGGEVVLPYTGTVRISGPVIKGLTTDSVGIQIYQDSTLIYNQPLNWNNTSTLDINLSRDVSKGQKFRFAVTVDSPVDLARISWEPEILYLQAEGADGTPIPITESSTSSSYRFVSSFATDIYSSHAVYTGWTAPKDGKLLIDSAFQVSGSGSFARTLTVKQPQKLLLKDQLSGSNNATSYTLDVAKGERYYFELTLHDGTVTASGTLEAVYEKDKELLLDPPVYSISYGINYPLGNLNLLPKAYRGWSYFAYRGSEEGQSQLNFSPINEGELTKEYQGEADYNAETTLVFPMVPAPEQKRWQSEADKCFITAAFAEAARKNVDYIARPGEVPTSNSRGITKIGTGYSFSLTGSLGAGANLSGSGGFTKGELDSMDMNGDRFPDLLGNGAIQYTVPSGALAEKKQGVYQGAVRETATISVGGGIGGNPLLCVPSGSGNLGTLLGKVKESMPPLGLSIGASASDSQGEKDFIDINGDGLPDRVLYDSATGVLKVAYNYGYSFGQAEVIGNIALLEKSNSNVNIGGSLGFQIQNYGFGGGLSISGSFSDSSKTLSDINGDGLVDIVQKTGGNSMLVYLNTGSGFTGALDWNGVISGYGLLKNENVNQSVSGYFTIPIPIPFFAPVFFIHINPGGDVSSSFSIYRSSLTDINGDGLPDHLVTTNDHNLKIAFNKTGKTNRLKKVREPLGGWMSLDYSRDGNSYELPQSKWILTSTTLEDGLADTEARISRYDYADPLYNRLEREFYGYSEVTTTQVDSGGNVLRVIEEHYNNSSYYSKGLLESRLVKDSLGKVYTETINSYDYVNVLTNAPVTADALNSTTLSIAPRLRGTSNRFYEGEPDYGMEQQLFYDYDEYGNVTGFIDSGALTADRLEARIQYEYDSTHYLVNNPSRILVYNNGELIRKREASYVPGKGKMSQLREYLADGSLAQYDLSYYADGNLQTLYSPYNYRSERFFFTYGYDQEVGTYVTGITDAFGYSSTATYNLLFGLDESSVDINGNRMRKEYDAAGRLIKLYGPYDGTQAALEISYSLDVFPAFAVTKNKIHFDPNKAETITTSIITDGLGRPVQTKKEAEVLLPGKDVADYGMTISGMVRFDALGRVVQEGQPIFEAGYNPAYSPGLALARPTSTAYDVLDRKTTITLPDQALIQNRYALEEGYFKTTVIDPVTNKQVEYKDVRGNRVKIEQFNQGKTITTSYRYNGLGENLQVEDTKGNLTSMRYDLLGRMLALDNGDSGLLEYRYDLASNLLEKTDPNLRARGQSITYEYQYNRLTKIIYPAMPSVNYSYGGPGAPYNRVGRLYRTEDESGWTEHSFGKMGETVSTVKSLNSLIPGADPLISQTGFLFDYLGRAEQISYPDGELLYYEYDKGGLITKAYGIKQGHTFAYVDKIYYDQFGQRSYILYGNGVETRYSYNPERRWLDHIRTVTSQGDLFQNMDYSFDLVGNIQEINNQGDKPLTQRFEYDDLYQLTYAEADYENGKDYDEVKYAGYYQEYQYDEIGNMQTKISHQQWMPSSAGNKHELNYRLDYLYESGRPHAPSRIGAYAYSYDLNGNLILKKELDVSGEEPQKQDAGELTKKEGHGNKNRGALIAKWETGKLSKNKHPQGAPPGLTKEKPGVGNGGKKHPQGGPPGLTGDKPKPEEKILTEEQYQWDEENRLRKVTIEGRETDFLYNASGQRSVKRGQHGESIYADQFSQYFNKNTLTKHIFVGETRIVSRLSQVEYYDEEYESCNLYFYHPDHLGSTSYVSNYAGEEFEHMEYTPYGESWIDEGSNKHLIGYRFTSKELDDETGLYYFGARYLDPKTSRWLSVDPAQDSLNWYGYAANNPLKFVDPTGMYNEADNGLTGEIEEGDTLTKIVNQHNETWGSNLTVDDVAKFNNIDNPNLIYAGDTINFESEKWTASGTEFYGGFEAVVGTESEFAIIGHAKMSFSNGDRVFRQNYNIEVLQDVGLSIGVGGAVMPTSANRLFPVGVSDAKIADEYTGNFYTRNVSGFVMYNSVFQGGGWKGISTGVGISFGSDLAFSRTLTNTFYTKAGDIFGQWDLNKLQPYKQ